MKGKIITGRGLSGLARYVNKPDAEHISGSTEPRDFLRTAAALRSLRPDVRQAAVHISISMPPGQPLTPAQWQQAGEILMREMDMQGLEFQLVRHHDTQHDHCHLIACKVRPDGSLWNDSHSARRLHRACEQIEREMKLEHTLTVAEHRATRKSGTASKPISDGALRAFQRTGAVPSKTKEAIARRIRKEREHEREAADRATHRTTDRLDDQNSGAARADARASQGRNPVPETANQNAGGRTARGFEADRSAGTATDRTVRPVQIDDDENPTECWLESSRSSPRPPFPPNLSGRLENRATPAPGAFDLYWSGRERPTFRWHSDSGQIQILAKPSEKNVSALFDLARESNLKPPLKLFGTPEFQRMAAEEARRRGIEIQPDNTRIAAEHREALRRTAEEAEAARAERERQRLAELDAQDKERAAEQHRRRAPAPRPPQPGEAP